MNHDTQKNRVYAWEDSWWGWNRELLGLDECHQTIKCACRLYKVKVPTLIYHATRELSFYHTTDTIISLQVGNGFNIPVCLHETAHHIVWDRHGDRVQDHGPIFVGIYLDLLENFKVAPPAALRASLRAEHIRWVPQDPNDPRKAQKRSKVCRICNGSGQQMKEPWRLNCGGSVKTR